MIKIKKELVGKKYWAIDPTEPKTDKKDLDILFGKEYDLVSLNKEGEA